MGSPLGPSHFTVTCDPDPILIQQYKKTAATYKLIRLNYSTNLEATRELVKRRAQG
jgi:hypothetical protein